LYTTVLLTLFFGVSVGQRELSSCLGQCAAPAGAFPATLHLHSPPHQPAVLLPELHEPHQQRICLPSKLQVSHALSYCCSYCCCCCCCCCCCHVQALDSSNPAVIKAQAALLRDRWAYFVRAAALQQHLTEAGSKAQAGSDVVAALSQVQDATSELLQLLQQLADTVAAVADAEQASPLQQLLVQHEAADELQDLLAWCQLQGPLDARPAADDSSAASVALDSGLLEKAWRLSFAPFAARGLAKALSSSSSSSSSGSPEESSRAVLEMTDLGLRLEEALEAASAMRASLATQLALNSL
jgi:hypothetical protein